MKDFGVKTKTGRLFSRKLYRIAMGKKMDKRALPKIFRKALAPVRDVARDLAPVDSGSLKQSISIRVSTGAKQDRYGRTAEGAVGVRYQKTEGRNPFYAPFLEYGTKHAAAQPFMQPAMDRKRRSAMRILKRGLRRIIIKEMRRA